MSPAVVSYVLNNSHPVSDATRARVVAAIEELGYRPNALARGLALARTHTIGLLIPESANPYFAELSSAIEDAAFEADVLVLLGNGAGSADREVAYVRAFLDRRVDGVIIIPSDDFTHGWDELIASGVPVVTTDRNSPDIELPSVVVDNLAGGRTATAHLLEHGRRRIACVSGELSQSPAKQRAEGWRLALAEAGVEPDDALLRHVPFTVEGGEEATLDLLRQHPDIDGIFVSSDNQAVGVLRALADSGRAVGEDVAVVSFDGTLMSDYTTPRLSTVAQPFADIAKTVVGLLLSLIEDPAKDRAEQHVLPTRLVIRGTCGCRAGGPALPALAAALPTPLPRHNPTL